MTRLAGAFASTEWLGAVERSKGKMMTIDELISSLAALKEKHSGDVDVTVWQYGGGLDDLCSVSPAYDPETRTVVLDTEIHESGQRR